MSGKKVGSDGQIRNTTAAWAADTKTYPEGMRLMDTDTGVVRVSKGTTYALAWVPASGGAVTSNDVSNDSAVTGATVTAALDQLDSDKQAARDELDFLNVAVGNVTAEATTDLGAEEGDTLTLVGTTEITSFGTADAGVLKKIICGSATPITYDANSMIIEGSASITTAAEDTFDALSLGSGSWIIRNYNRRDGSPLVSEVDNNLTASTTRAGSKTAINTALALKPDVFVNGTRNTVIASVTGLTNVNGRLTVDLSVANGDRPALATAHFIGGSGDEDAGTCQVGRVHDATLSSFTVQFFDVEGAAATADAVAVQFTVIGTTA